MALTDAILARASSLGFDRVAIVPVGSPRYTTEFAAWLAAGYHGEMGYLAERSAERLDPARLAPGASSMIVAVVNYNPGEVQGGCRDPNGSGPQGMASVRIARYARSADYHRTLRPRLLALDAFIRERTGRTTFGKAFVDAAPVLERDLAEQAGLGFIGRNTCLITPGLGSWTFLAGLLVPEVLEAGSWVREAVGVRRLANQGCGRCTRCLDACPTRAFVAPHVLDARRCISYLTIELRGPIPRALRQLMGNWIFGCDVCQEVCPYNRDAPAMGGLVTSCVGGTELASLGLREVLALDEAAFRAACRGSPVLRAKRRGLVRNACIAAGNSGDPAFSPVLIALLEDPEPLVRGHAAWALASLGDQDARRALDRAAVREPDPWVLEEIELGRAVVES